MMGSYSKKWLWMMTMMMVLNSMIKPLQVYSCWDQERAALLLLKASSLHPANSWKDDNTSDCCGWEGVTCGAGNKRIISLTILGNYSEDVKGYVINASNFLPLQELQKLDLSSNSLASWTEAKGIEKLAASLKKLVYLDLSYNYFNNSILSKLSGFSSLKHLDLRGNELKGTVQLHDIKAICNNLEVLNLSSNEVSSFQNHDGCGQKHELPEGLKYGNTSCFNGLPSIRELDLSFNELVGEVPMWLQNLTTLKSLDLSYNQLVGEIPSWFQNLTTLESLDLSVNHLSGDIRSCFRNLTTLKSLDLSYNQLVGEIPSWFQNLTTLESLDLSNNQFVGNIGTSLIRLNSLEYLALSNNHFQIPLNSFANHTKLKYFLGDSNHIVHDTSTPDIQKPFSHGLQVLSMSNCTLLEYPNLLHHRDLRVIDLSDNFLQGVFPAWLVENNTRLDTLILRNCSLSGSLKLPRLTHPYLKNFNVAQNKIQGHIPSNIGMVFPKLIILDLSNNAFKGSIPSSLRNMKSLKGLYLSNNHVSKGTERLSKTCTNLEGLDLSNNDFSEKLPSFQGLLNLQSLKLQGNKFSGSIPDNMFASTSLGIVNLSNNSIEGPIPKQVCNFSTLHIMDLSFNKLNGTLPYCSNFNQDFPNSFSLLLNNNRLSGHLTDAFCNNALGLMILDLSYNNLTGPIPTAIGNLVDLNALVLRGNQFYGRVPIQLCELVNLQVLDLSSNYLTGLIPTCIGKVPFYNSSAYSLLTLGIGRYEMSPSSTILVQLIQDKGDSYHHNSYSPKVTFTTKSNMYSYEGDMFVYLYGIDLSCNKLTGQIPHELGNLSNIKALNLSHNRLWGVIPSSFSNLRSIESMDLSYNNLNGSIPTTLTTLNALGDFKLAYNNFSGRIPYEGHLSTFDNLTYEGNSLLCGPPLSKQCAPSEAPSAINTGDDDGDGDGDGEWIDLEIFYVTFAISSATMFVAVVIIMLVNSHWHDLCCSLVKACITSSCYFFKDTIRKLKRARCV